MTRSIFLDRPRAPAPLWAKVTTFLLVLLVLSLLCTAALWSSTNQWAAVWRYREAFGKGWLLTLGISSLALVGSTVIGVLAALAKRSEILVIRYLSTTYIDFVRGTPFLVLILLLFYGLPQITQHASRLFIGVLALSLFSGAYIAEMVRAGIAGVGLSQRESARAIGLTTFQTYRYVIFPQALRQILPPLTGQFASLIKDSSLLFVIGLPEVTYTAQQINSATYSTLESFLPLALAYLVLTLPISLMSNGLEKLYRYES
jgi:polar amino acid transport system permease protein